MTTPEAGARSRRNDVAQEMFDHDRRVERRMLWKGALSLLIIAVVIVVRQRYLI